MAVAASECDKAELRRHSQIQPDRPPLDHPFVKEGRFALLLVGDRKVADSLADRFQEFWRKAMKSLREIQVDPRGHPSRPARPQILNSDLRFASATAKRFFAQSIQRFTPGRYASM